MRNFTTAVSATLTAIIIALLIANVASAARAAEIAHDKEQQLAAVQDSYSTNDLASQLEAYRTRYAQAYQQLAVAYQTLYARDADYRAALDRANAMSGQLANTDATLEAKLNEAYQALRDAQALVNSLRSPSAPPSATPTRAAPLSPAMIAPTASAPGASRATSAPRTSATPRPTPTQYCWYDQEGKRVCEDHPRGE